MDRFELAPVWRTEAGKRTVSCAVQASPRVYGAEGKRTISARAALRTPHSARVLGDLNCEMSSPESKGSDNPAGELDGGCGQQTNGFRHLLSETIRSLAK